MVLLIPTVYGIEICLNPTTPNQIPCMIVSTYKYDNCTLSQAYIYNETPELVSVRNFSYYGDSQFCNFTWNITTTGSYKWNVTPDGDTGKLNVEVDETMNLAIAVGLGLIGTIFIIIALILFMRGKDDTPTKT